MKHRLLPKGRENLFSWGGSIRASEGVKMSNSLKASRSPFCVVVNPAADQKLALLLQLLVDLWPKNCRGNACLTPESARRKFNVVVIGEIRNNMRLREEQDVAYTAAFEEADQV
ncbi:Plant UBX domain-containing protein 10 [Raphanus sativus]|nr:Plant UBX domain-containing protein 10 [Raphanus sativus]